MNGNEDVPIILKHPFEFRHDPLLLLNGRKGLYSNVLKVYGFTAYLKVNLQVERFLLSTENIQGWKLFSKSTFEVASLVTDVNILLFVRGEFSAVNGMCQLRD